MSRSNKSKIAVTLLSALAFGANDASAMNSSLNTKSDNKIGFSTEKNSKSGAEIPKLRGTLNIRNDSSGNKIFNWVKNHKAVSIAAPLVTTGAVGFAIWGVKHKSKGDQGPKGPSEQDPNKDLNKDLNKEKDNEQNPIILPNNLEPKVTSNTNPQFKELVIPKKSSQNVQNIQNMQNSNIMSGPQQQQYYTQFVGQHADTFAQAVSDFNGQHPTPLPVPFVSSVLKCFKEVFPSKLNVVPIFDRLAKLGQQNNVKFGFRNVNSQWRCCAMIDNRVAYEFYLYGAGCTDVCIEYYVYDPNALNDNWPLINKMKIENGIVSPAQ